MIELYILIGFSTLVLALFAWGKVNASITKTERVKAQAATATAKPLLSQIPI